ncbi:hypothetical protein ACFQU2_19095 [Siccirubricoccus deserti]
MRQKPRRASSKVIAVLGYLAEQDQIPETGALNRVKRSPNLLFALKEPLDTQAARRIGTQLGQIGLQRQQARTAVPARKEASRTRIFKIWNNRAEGRVVDDEQSQKVERLAKAGRLDDPVEAGMQARGSGTEPETRTGLALLEVKTWPATASGRRRRAAAARRTPFGRDSERRG